MFELLVQNEGLEYKEYVCLLYNGKVGRILKNGFTTLFSIY